MINPEINKNIEEKNKQDFILNLEKNREIFNKIETEEFLKFIEKSKKVNEGQNGIILKLNKNEKCLVLEKIKELEKKENINKESEKTIKILKVFNFENLKEEFENLKEAYSIVNTQIDKEKYCNIPFPIFLKEIDLDKNLKEKIKEYGVKSIDEKIGIMVMEYVKGEDLFNFLAKKVIDKNNQKEQDNFAPEYFYNEQTSLEEFTRDLNFILKWEELGEFNGLSKKEAEERIEITKLRKIYDYLKPRQKDDFVFSKDACKKIENTIELFHKNGFFHRDLHERNIILNNGGEEVSLIDFGNSIRNFEGNEQDVYKKENTDNVFTMKDNEVLNLLKTLSFSLDEKKELLQNKKIKELEKASKKFWGRKVDEKKSKIFYEGDEFFLDLVIDVLKENKNKLNFDFEKYYKKIFSNQKMLTEEKIKLLQVFLKDLLDKTEEFIFLKEFIAKKDLKDLLVKKLNEEKNPVIKNALVETIKLLF